MNNYMEKDLFRREKGTLTIEQMARVDYIKTLAEDLRLAIGNSEDLQNPKLNADTRCLLNSIHKLEEAVMWAVKGYTNSISK